MNGAAPSPLLPELENGAFTDRSLEAVAPLDPEQFRRLGHQMVDFIADYYSNITKFPVRSSVQPGYLRPLLPDRAPEKGEQLDVILQDFASKILPGITHWQSPNFYAYFPANSSTAGMLGSMLDHALNVIGFSWISSPAATELETVSLDWLGRMMQLPAQFLSVESGGVGGGVIQGSASEAVLVALLAARKRAMDALLVAEEQEKEGGGGVGGLHAYDRLVVYTSDQAHSCVQKACMVAGIPASNVRLLPTSSATSFSLCPSILTKAVAADKAAGLVPFFLTATVGTTSSGAVDPISELGAIANSHGMWMHVDAAYAGSACICPEFRHHLHGVEKADSLCTNAHKWLLTNFDCSCLWVKDSKSLVNALSIHPEYLRNKATDAHQVVDYKDWQIPLGRTFRSLKLWMVLRMHGVSGLQQYIRGHVAMARRFEELVNEDARFEILAPVHFSLVCFRLKPMGSADTDNGKMLNHALMEAVNSSGKLFFTHTVLDGVLALRMAIGGSQTSMENVEEAWRTIKEEAERLEEHN